MEVVKKVFLMSLISFFTFSILYGCSFSTKEPYYSEFSEKQNKEYDICIYNSRNEIAESLSDLCHKYYSETGVKIKVLSCEKNDYFSSLYEKLNSFGYPAIYSVHSLPELDKLRNDGFISNIENLSMDEFKELSRSLPDEFKLSTNHSDNYGIPYGIEGYGYIVNKGMVSSIFGKSHEQSFIKNLKSSSYYEFENLIHTLNEFIKNPKSMSVCLNGTEYSTASQKDGLANNLNGVFAVAGSDSWTYVNHMINIALNAKFSSKLDAFEANSSKIDTLRDPIKKYVKALDLKTSNTAGHEKGLPRSENYINPDINNYEQSVKIFLSGKAFFIKQGSWIIPAIKKINPDLVDADFDIIPVKLPLSKDDVSAQNLDIDKINNSITVDIFTYYAINDKISEKEKKLAQNFLYWLNTSDLGKQYISDNFIPFNSSNNFDAQNAITKAILEYQKNEKVLRATFLGTPFSRDNTKFGENLKNKYLTKAYWDENDYNDIIKSAIEELKNK